MGKWTRLAGLFRASDPEPQANFSVPLSIWGKRKPPNDLSKITGQITLWEVTNMGHKRNCIKAR